MKLKFKAALAAVAVAILSGCASGDYAQYAKIKQDEAKWDAVAKVAAMDAIKEIAKTGDTTARTVASLQIGDSLKGTNVAQASQGGTVAPTTAGQEARAWAGILVPSIVQGYGIKANRDVSIIQSNNSRDIAVSTNDTFLGLGSLIKPNYTNSFNANGMTSSVSTPATNFSGNGVTLGQ